ncbi:mutator type transposase [Tanacetum coccineum]
MAVQQLKTNPYIPVRGSPRALTQNLELNVIRSKAFRAKHEAEKKLRVVSKAGMRDLLGLDGAFMRDHTPGSSRNTEFHLTFVSDKAKGIIPAIANLFPNAEHRYCVKHIHENMKKRWNGNAYKELLWTAASTTTVPEFQKSHGKGRSLAKKLMSVRAKSDVLLNNMCEVFNGKLVGGRDKPIISTLEFAREYLMKRFSVHGILTRLWLKLWLEHAPCRRWELTGIPCKHVVATNWVMSLNNEAGIPEEWVHPCYRLETWKKVYSFKIKPIRGHIHWPKCNVPTTILPPKHQPQVGRTHQRRKNIGGCEGFIKDVKNGKLSRSTKTVTCNKCNTKGHNSRSCTGPRVAKTNKRKVQHRMDDILLLTVPQGKQKAKDSGCWICKWKNNKQREGSSS